MSSKVRCYLRTLRNQWGLTQEELASLLNKGDRKRVMCVESGEAQPNAREILAYQLIFGVPPRDIFPKFCEELDEAVMQGAYRLHQALEDDQSPEAGRKRQLLEQIRSRAVNNLQQKEV
jgi:transcriptional regulator with XRE-family HTH domain